MLSFDGRDKLSLFDHKEKLLSSILSTLSLMHENNGSFFQYVDNYTGIYWVSNNKILLRSTCSCIVIDYGYCCDTT